MRVSKRRALDRHGRPLPLTTGDRAELARFSYFLRLVNSRPAEPYAEHLLPRASPGLLFAQGRRGVSPVLDGRPITGRGLRPLQLAWLNLYASGQSLFHGLRPGGA
jgi:hypothetical protein